MAEAENTKCRSVRFGEIFAVAKNVRTQIYTRIKDHKECTNTNIHKNKKPQRMYTNIHKNTKLQRWQTQIYTRIQNCKKGTQKNENGLHKNAKNNKKTIMIVMKVDTKMLMQVQKY